MIFMGQNFFFDTENKFVNEMRDLVRLVLKKRTRIESESSDDTTEFEPDYTHIKKELSEGSSSTNDDKINMDKIAMKKGSEQKDSDNEEDD